MEQPDLPFAKASDTSRAAAKTASTNAKSVRARVLAYLSPFTTIGVTCDDVERNLGLRPNVASARLWELRRDGAIIDSGQRRATSRGSLAVVWRLRRDGEPADVLECRRLTRLQVAARLRGAMEALEPHDDAAGVREARRLVGEALQAIA